jgi:hypothetical protein
MFFIFPVVAKILSDFRFTGSFLVVIDPFIMRLSNYTA